MKAKYLKSTSILIITIWLGLFALIPFGFNLVISFLSSDYTSLFILKPTLHQYISLSDIIYLKIFLRSFIIATITTLLCLLLAYPFAYTLTQLKQNQKTLLLLLVIIPLWTSSLVRTYAMIAILKTNGLINKLLFWLGIIDAPLNLLYNQTAVVIGLVYNLLPFMILPLYSHLQRLDFKLIDAAKDLGADRWTLLRKILIPLTKPGIIAGSILVFLPAMTLFYIPMMLGGARSMLIGNLIHDQFLLQQNWPLGAASNTVLSVIFLLFVILYTRTNRTENQL